MRISEAVSPLIMDIQSGLNQAFEAGIKHAEQSANFASKMLGKET